MGVHRRAAFHGGKPFLFHVIMFLLVRFPTFLFSVPPTLKSLTKSRAATESVRDELKVAREKRMHARVTSSSEDGSPSKRQRTTEVNGREKGGVKDGTFPVAAEEAVREELGNGVVSNGNGDALSETWPREE